MSNKKRFNMSENHKPELKQPEQPEQMPAISGHQVGHKIIIPETQQNELRQMEDVASKLKTAIADLHMQSRMIEKRVEEVATELVKVQEQFVTKAREFATNLGIDVDNPDKGRWDLDTTSMTFTKIS
jgi:hypothetical protein